MAVRGRYLRFADTLDEAANAAVRSLARHLERTRPDGVREVYGAFGNVYLEWDDELLDDAALRRWCTEPPVNEETASRTVTLRVRYGALDTDEVCAATGLDAAELAARHAAGRFTVLCVGAAPGQPFLGPNHDGLVMPRLATPRLAVPAHALAITGRQSTVYPVTMPGGWNVIGEALERVYDPHRSEPFLFEPGDTVRLVAADGAAPPPPLEPVDLLPSFPDRPLLRVEQAGPLDLVVDAGRLNGARHGVAAGGPADAPAARLANALVGNEAGASVVETTLYGPTLVVLAPAIIGVAGAGVVAEVDGERVGCETLHLRRGQRLRLLASPHGVRGYLAIAGGVASGTFHGSSSVDLRGLIGRPLRPGDALGAARDATPTSTVRAQQTTQGATPVRLQRGPQWTAEAQAALENGAFTMTVGDRTGIRFAGTAVPGGEVLSECPPEGAVQVTPAGTPIILGTDRLRLGGYAKPAVVVEPDRGRLAQLRPGETVRFRFIEEPLTGWYEER